MQDNYKYIWNMGLAFDEDRVLKKMSVLAEKGWILKEMTALRYKLEKSEPKELVYSMDQKNLKEDKEEYFELFNSSGWKHMCSYGPFHFFSASKGTVPIYTDKESYLEKYKGNKMLVRKMLIISILSLLIVTMLDFFVAARLNNEVFDIVLFLVGAISAAILAPTLMLTVAYIIRLKNNKGLQ